MITLARILCASAMACAGILVAEVARLTVACSLFQGPSIWAVHLQDFLPANNKTYFADLACLRTAGTPEIWVYILMIGFLQMPAEGANIFC